jgi:hypothetical protein
MKLPIAFHNSKDFGLIIGEPIKLGKPFFGTSEEYKMVIPKIKAEYKKIEENSGRDLNSVLNIFLKEVSSYAILGYDFIRVLSERLNISEIEIIKVLTSTDYVLSKIEYIKKNFRKRLKENSLEYAEEIGELVSLLGVENTYNLLKKNGIKVGKTTLNCFYKVAMMPSKIKKLIEENKLPLTIAFELPEEKIEEAAEKVTGLSFIEARKVLKEIKRRNLLK